MFLPTDHLLFKMEGVNSKIRTLCNFIRKPCYTYYMNAFVLEIFGFSTEKTGLFSEETYLSRCNFELSTEKRYNLKNSDQ